MMTIPTFRQTGAGNLFIINSDYEEEKLLRQTGRWLTTRTNIVQQMQRYTHVVEEGKMMGIRILKL